MHRALLSTLEISRLAIFLSLSVVASGCGGDSTASSQRPAPLAPGGEESPQALKPTGEAAAPAGRYAIKKQEPPPVVRLNTSVGPIDIRLDPDAAPVTVSNFLKNAQAGHYDQTVFHYVENDQLILGGGYLDDGSLKPFEGLILNEAHNGRQNKRGTVAMARDAGMIDSTTSQFFINLQDAPHLDHAGETPEEYGYCVFGEVVEGLDVAREISAAPIEKQKIEGEELSVPTQTVRIESVQVLR